MGQEAANALALGNNEILYCECPMFRPILTTNDLPREGEAHEELTHDFKIYDATAHDFEMAKDMAAFANASGGTIIVGVAENHENGKRALYRPISRNESPARRRGYEEAAQKFCIPSPVIAATEIAYGGGIVLVVNVWPAIGTVVGVEVKRSNRPEDKHTGRSHNSYIFPLRVGTQTTFLTPSQIAMLMLPNVRRIVVLLSGIPLNAQVEVQSVEHRWNQTERYNMGSVDVLCNRVVLFDSRKTANYLPLDAIDTVWQDGESWRIAIRGVFVPSGPSANKSYWAPHS